MNLKVFGRSPSGERLERIKRSPNYRHGQFHNVEPTEVIPSKASFFTMWLEFSRRPKTVVPQSPIPSVNTDLINLRSEKPMVVWFGHSSYLIKSRGYSVLVDPVFSGNASPFRAFGKAFPGSNHYQAEDMPPIDALVLTHDHYDHLDHPTITKLAGSAGKVVTALGVGAHLEYWGVTKDKIIEMDWLEKTELTNDISITALPSRHFSGRRLRRNQTLWCAFALNIHGSKVFLGGDSGYDRQFSIIGGRFGGFDLAILECGQYGRNWPLIHMMPEETVRAAMDLGAKTLLPVHWGKFNLSTHPWDEPVRRLLAQAAAKGQPVATPMIGEPYQVGAPAGSHRWWDEEEGREIREKER
jgi:L-ascorbate metabolism protein UlaG (beta-lactamase superfamily)